MSLALANTVLNTIVAESIDEMSDKLEAAVKDGKDLDDAVLEVVREYYVGNKRIVFDGDGYSEEWHAGGRQARAVGPQDDARRAARR